MGQAARSVFWFGVYLAVAGTGLVFAPRLVLAPVGIPAPQEVWIRVVGILALCLAVYYVVAARSTATAVMRATVPVRVGVTFAFGDLVALSLAPAGLLVFAAIDLAGAVWTALALRAGG